MANAEDPLEVTEADALHPSGTSAALEALDHRGRCPLDAEAVRQFEGDRRGVLCTQKAVDERILGLCPSTTAGASPARAAARGSRQVTGTG